MTEKEQFLNAMSREFAITLKVLNAYPTSKSEMKPHPKCKTARELAWNFVAEQKASEMALEGKFDFSRVGSPPATMPEVISSYEMEYARFIDILRQTPEAELNGTVKFVTGPKQMSDVRKMDVLWFMLMDNVHHRGQMSIYLRMADGRVPSIYGPSADEPWQ